MKVVTIVALVFLILLFSLGCINTSGSKTPTITKIPAITKSTTPTQTGIIVDDTYVNSIKGRIRMAKIQLDIITKGINSLPQSDKDYDLAKNGLKTVTNEFNTVQAKLDSLNKYDKNYRTDVLQLNTDSIRLVNDINRLKNYVK